MDDGHSKCEEGGASGSRDADVQPSRPEREWDLHSRIPYCLMRLKMLRQNAAGAKDEGIDKALASSWERFETAKAAEDRQSMTEALDEFLVLEKTLELKADLQAATRQLDADMKSLEASKLVKPVDRPPEGASEKRHVYTGYNVYIIGSGQSPGSDSGVNEEHSNEDSDEGAKRCDIKNPDFSSDSEDGGIEGGPADKCVQPVRNGDKRPAGEDANAQKADVEAGDDGGPFVERRLERKPKYRKVTLSEQGGIEGGPADKSVPAVQLVQNDDDKQAAGEHHGPIIRRRKRKLKRNEVVRCARCVKPCGHDKREGPPAAADAADPAADAELEVLASERHAPAPDMCAGGSAAISERPEQRNLSDMVAQHLGSFVPRFPTLLHRRLSELRGSSGGGSAIEDAPTPGTGTEDSAIDRAPAHGMGAGGSAIEGAPAPGTGAGGSAIGKMNIFDQIDMEWAAQAEPSGGMD